MSQAGGKAVNPHAECALQTRIPLAEWPNQTKRKPHGSGSHCQIFRWAQPVYAYAASPHSFQHEWQETKRQLSGDLVAVAGLELGSVWSRYH